MTDTPLTDIFRAQQIAAAKRPLGTPAYMTAWNATTYANTVSVGGLSQGYQNLPVILPGPGVGPVYLLHTPSGPIVLGRIVRAEGA